MDKGVVKMEKDAIAMDKGASIMDKGVIIMGKDVVIMDKGVIVMHKGAIIMNIGATIMNKGAIKKDGVEPCSIVWKRSSNKQIWKIQKMGYAAREARGAPHFLDFSEFVCWVVFHAMQLQEGSRRPGRPF